MIKPDNSGSFRPDINGVRAIAVVIVVLFHFGISGFSGGFIGVDVFFVISGYLMTKIIVSRLQQGRFSLSDFLAARVRRIFPALAVLCMALLLIGWLSLDPIDYATLAVHVASALTFISNFVFWKQVNYFDAAAHEKWLLHTWSLSAEWQFYLLLPVVLMIVWRIFRSSRALAIGIAATFAVSLAMSIVLTDLRPVAAYYILPTRAWEMVAGGVVLLLEPHLKLSRSSLLAIEWLGLALIAGGTVMLDAGNPWPGYLALIPIFGTALIILACNTQSPVTCNPVSAFIGETSYSIYLWHWPVVVWVGFRGLAGIPSAIVAGIVASFVLGYLSFRWVETTTRHAWDVTDKKREMLAYASVLTVLVATALFVDQYRGFPHRLAPDEAKYQNVASAIGDWGHPGSNCRVQAYATLCLDEGRSSELVMFIGDSLAEQWYPRYGEHAGARDRTTVFVTKGACMPIRGVDSLANGANCREFADLAWEEVFARKPRKLIIASIWVTNFHYETGQPRNAVCIRVGDDCKPVDSRQIPDVFALLGADIRKAIDQGTEVFVFGPPPMNSVDYPKLRLAEIAAQRLLLPVTARANATQLGVEFKNDGRAYARAEISTLLATMATESGAKLIRLDQHMCPAGRCSLVDASGSPINKDTGHLRRSYVQSPSVAWLDTEIGLH